jgi:hypothetical protein
MLSRPTPDDQSESRTLRGHIFTDLDRLAFALEMEAAELIRAGRWEDAERRTSERLGVRLAQRLVTGVWADEVDLRVNTWSDAYNQRLGGEG